MTAPARQAQFDRGQQHRRAMLAKVHIAKKQLMLSEDDYRQILGDVTGRSSSRDCTAAELEKLLERFEGQGFSAKAKKPGSAPRPADSPMAKKARALWISLHQLGAIDNPSEQALEAFARRQLGVERMQWADQGRAYKLIEALKAIGARHGWDQSPHGLAVLKHALIDAIMAKLVAAGMMPADWDVARAAFEFGGLQLDTIGASYTELDLLAATLGKVLREATA